MVTTTIGVILICIQILAYIGSISGGVQFFATFSINELFYFIGFNLVGIIGVICLISGIRAQNTQTSELQEETQTHHEPKTLHELPKEEQKSEASEENKTMNIFTSKRIAAVISILLCVTLYLSFITVFTTKRDTYICYTTKTGECFHSATCRYLNTAYETTVYEASQEYKKCKYCNPCVEQYKTTLTERNYIRPILISVPISAIVFALLAFKKKKQRRS